MKPSSPWNTISWRAAIWIDRLESAATLFFIQTAQENIFEGDSGNTVIARGANRIGVETGESCGVTFYGSSFIADHTGAKLAEADRVSESVITAALNMEAMAELRRTWGVFRDRRTDLYSALMKPTPLRLMPSPSANAAE